MENDKYGLNHRYPEISADEVTSRKVKMDIGKYSLNHKHPKISSGEAIPRKVKLDIDKYSLNRKHLDIPTSEVMSRKVKSEIHKYSLNHKHPEFSAGEVIPQRKTNPYKPQANKNDGIIFISFFIFSLFSDCFLVWKTRRFRNGKRALQQKPILSPERLFNGEYSKEFEAYYADQFPMRNQFMGLYKSLVTLMNTFPGGKQKIHLVTGAKNQPNDILKANNPHAKKQDINNQFEQNNKSETNLENILKEKNNDEKGDNSAKIVEEKTQNRELQYNDNSNIIIDGKAMEIFGYFPENAVAYANRINYLRDVLPDQVRLIHLIAPPAIAFNGLEELESESKIVYQAIEQIYQTENDSIIKVDAITNIAKHADEYIYFNTDHHWTGRGAYYAYQAFCFYTGQTATALEDMELTKPDYKFLGSLYSFTGNSPLLENSKDQAEIFLPKHSGTNTVYSDTSMSDGVPTMLLDSESEIDSQYILYSGGDVALSLIKSNIDNGKSILVIKDSYANAFLPFLMDNYENIYSVDPRYMTDPIYILSVKRALVMY